MRRAPRCGLQAIVLLVVLLVCGAAWADHPEKLRLRQIGVSDGLPSQRVNAMVQDPFGYLWIGTSDGLARHDGLRMQILREEDGLPVNFVWSLAWRHDGTLWIGTRRHGLAIYDPGTGALRTLDRTNLPGLASNDIWALDAQDEDAVWIGTADAGLYRLFDDGRIERFMPRTDDPRSLPHASILRLVRDAEGGLWVATRGGVAKWEGGGFRTLEASRALRVRDLSFDRAGNLWLGTSDGALLLDPTGRAVAPPQADDARLSPIGLLLEDRDGGQWIDVAAGLGYIEQGKVREVPLFSLASQEIVRPHWTSGFEDREGGVWLMSFTHGLWYQPPGWNVFAVRSPRSGDDDSIQNAHVRGMSPGADGRLWMVGSGGALETLEPATGRLRRHLHDVAEGIVLEHVFEDSRGVVWIGWHGGLARFDPVSGDLQRWVGDRHLFGTTGRLVGTAENEQGVWFLYEDGIVHLRDGAGRVLQRYGIDDAPFEPGETLHDLAVGPDGRPWLATSQGLRRLRDERWERVGGVEAGVPQMAIHVDAARSTVALAGHGTVEVARWEDDRLHSSVRMGSAHGLPRLAFSGIVQDADGVFWLSSGRGLYRVDAAKRGVRAYGIADGLPSQEFPRPLVLDPVTKHVFAGSPDGLVEFDPRALVPSTDPPELVIERVTLRGALAPLRQLSTEAFSLRHDDLDLQVVARILSFRNPQAHTYAFRLEGKDPDWIEVPGGERTFPALPPGQHTLTVRGRNEDGVWSAPSTLQFEVTPPWWQRWPAAVAFGLLGLVALWWLGAGYRRRLRRRNAWQLAEHKREIAEQASLAKSRFLATLGHEVRTPMTGVLGMSELLLGTRLDEQQQRYAESIRDAGQHLLRLVNDALDLARIEAGRLELDPKPFDLRALLLECIQLMAPMASQRGLSFNERIDPDVPPSVLGDVVRVRQILLNLLGNAIKFTDHGFVELCVEAPQGDIVRFVVGDSGPGLNQEQRERLFRRFEQGDGPRTAARYGGSGLGLAICQELAAEMGGRIEVDSGPGTGTRFTVDLPLPSVSLRTGEEARTVPQAPGTLFLLLVEDDPTVAEVISGLLQAQGHRVLHVAHGLAALVSLATAEVDAALLDLDLPGIDGLALARQMRAQGFSRPLIAITARADADAEPLAMQAGFDGFLRKPLTGAILANALVRFVPAHPPVE